ncbi:MULTISPECIES: TorF family putative porin [Pseudoxanthomonas]|jgi:uncharacterized protein (TIGR02001 family)|uniref:Uncharacterized protein n=1 Tax=Pseudoxanthomonas winnipegensis TaxID=2480810 RepID=A0A4Q8LG14_9GAMM|nr:MULTISPECIES: TorF family putative porin [Pseudoxanthomonas]PZP59640.1 MAG: hypothetical protein DI597_13995 [Pseudoxanthomonas spadix]TAA28372.1 hypothetical protein EA660_01940 [Pseudoxanthomonas winnipegensis]TMN19818.1 hypothetical protein FF950_10490 [Pseudoxanthomonas sp. X-1]UAY73762.1 TorF family putative porin [Pseudoxanthomonas sp. X-1]
MKSKKLRIALALALAGLPLVAFAQEAAEPASSWKWSLTATTDYRFRGLSQTDVGPAFQPGLTYHSPIGLYVGTWASNVDFGKGDPDYEVDAFVGYNVDASDWLNLDFMINRYNYPGAGSGNYNEFITKATIASHFTALVAYTDNIFNSDTDSWYYQGGVSWGLPHDFSVAATGGVTEFEDGSVGRDYKDWSVSLSKAFGPATLTAAYIGTDGDGRDAYGHIADSRFVVSVTVAN